MSFRNLNINTEYRSLQTDIVKYFYIPILKESTMYSRAVGFFSSTALVQLSKGICGLVKNNGKIRIIASPKLSDEDLEAIKDGYDRRKTILNSIIRELGNHNNKFEQERLNLLSNLIANNILDIKIAYLEHDNSLGMFHEKMGIMKDYENNYIAFSGSMNESYNAYNSNYECIDVFTSWSSDCERVNSKRERFEKMWENCESRIEVLSFPEVKDIFLDKYKQNDFIDLELDEKEFDSKEKSLSINCLNEDVSVYSPNTPHIPNDVKIRDYQQQAIDNWVSNNYRGIFDMATGTGKTYTALAAIVRLYNDLNGRLAVIIVCPYQHLVEQWVEDLEKFGMKPIIAYSASKQKDWKDRLNRKCLGFKYQGKYFCCITTNATFASSYFQNIATNLETEVLLVADEAHNLGASGLSKCLPRNFLYRLALSATLERYGDIEGTNKLYNYFGNKCVEYTLEEAIKNEKLTRYFYYPIVVSLNESELEEYLILTEKIGKALNLDKNGKIILDDFVKMLLIKRARLVAGANSKLIALKDIISKKYMYDNNMLIYCGATTVNDYGYNEDTVDNREKRQIDEVLNILGNELGLKVRKFTSEESPIEREEIKKQFANGNGLQALVAIRCLDEGVNVPGIRTAFILASSTNPKEYIQRRGRVLRLAKDKDYATIYDFISLPYPLDFKINDELIHSTKGLVLKEVKRIIEFSRLSENTSESDILINKIQSYYGFNAYEEEETYV